MLWLTTRGPSEETPAEMAQRAYDFLLWLRARPETEIVVSSHSAWLFSAFNAVMRCDPPELAEWFHTGEMRSVRISFEG